MKSKLNLADEFFLNKMTEIISIIIVVRFAFCENNKYYPQVFLDVCIHLNANAGAKSYNKETKK